VWTSTEDGLPRDGQAMASMMSARSVSVRRDRDHSAVVPPDTSARPGRGAGAVDKGIDPE